MSGKLRLWFGVLLGGLGLILVLQNQDIATAQFLFWSVEGPLFMILGLVLVLGLIGGYLLGRTGTKSEKKR